MSTCKQYDGIWSETESEALELGSESLNLRLVIWQTSPGIDQLKAVKHPLYPRLFWCDQSSGAFHLLLILTTRPEFK